MALTQSTQYVKVPASEKYEEASFLKKIFLGRNYRKEWSTPATMPVFYLQKEKNGFTVTELGGGMQTKTLELKDPDGNSWALRTVDKEVEKTLPSKLRKTFIKKIVQDMISASYPYAALTIPDLAKAVGVHTGSQQVFYVPDDPALGQYRSLFANKVCLLEQRSLPLVNEDTLETAEVLERLVKNNDRKLNQKNLLKARLLDMLIADWDRHEGQWKWGVRHASNRSIYEPLPRDRDQAYFNSNGLLMRLISILFMPHMRGFKSRPDALQKLNLKSWEFDKDLLNELDKETWEETVREFQRNITDSIIHLAVKKLPAEIYEISGKLLEEKLRLRRNALFYYVMKYYTFLAENVEIKGTDKAEYFRIVSNNDKIAISVYNHNTNDSSNLIYHRVFDADETNRIYLKGLGDKDHYKVEGKISGLKIFLDGGKGKDEFDTGGNNAIRLQDTDQS